LVTGQTVIVFVGSLILVPARIFILICIRYQGE
jgi:hypothetical protein